MIPNETTPNSTQPVLRPSVVPQFGSADVVMILTMVTWGFNFIVLKVGVTQLSPMAFTTIRHIGASILLLTMLKARRTSLHFSRKEWLWLVGLGLLGIAFHQPFAMYAVQKTTVGNAG